VEKVLEYGTEEKNDFMVFFHLSVLSFCIFPLGNIMIPLILWLTKRDKITGLNVSGKSVIYYQLVWTILTSVSWIAFVFAKIYHNDWWSIYLYVTVGLCLINILSSIFNATRASKNRKSINFIGGLRFH